MRLLACILAVLALVSCGSSDFVNDYSWDAATPDAQSRQDAHSPLGDAGRQDSQQVGDATLTPDGSAPQSLRIAVVSDLNGSYGSTNYDEAVHGAVAAIISGKPDVVLSTGDMVAGQKEGLDYRAMWRGFHAAVSDPLSAANIPFAVSPGNHDASGYNTFAAERDIYVDEWSNRKPALDYVDDEYYPLRYAFKVQDTLFIALDDTTIGPLSDGQMKWLNNVLSSNPARVKIVFGHVPLYPFSSEKASEIIGDAALEDLLNDHQVDAFISGHHHAYYPGKRASLRLTGMPCIGAGPRKLVGQAEVSVRAIVMIEIDGKQIGSIHGYPAGDFSSAIARSALPESIGSGSQVITRDDL